MYDILKLSKFILKRFFNIEEEKLEPNENIDTTIIKNLNTKLNELSDINKNFKKYNTDWSYEYLENSMTSIIDDIFKYFKTCNNEELLPIQTKQKNMSRKFKKLLKFYAWSIKFVKNSLDFIELFLSVILIITVSKISHFIEARYETLIMSSAIAVNFALLKIFIEKKFLTPLINKIAYKKFDKMLKRLSIMLSTKIAFYYANEVLKIDKKNSRKIKRDIFHGFSEIEDLINKSSTLDDILI